MLKCKILLPFQIRAIRTCSRWTTFVCEVFKQMPTVNKMHCTADFLHCAIANLPPYSGAMKCMFLMFSRHVLTWWWIASGATVEREREKQSQNVHSAVPSWLWVFPIPHPLLSHLSAGQFHTQRLRTDSKSNSFCPRSRKVHDPSHQRTYAIGDKPQTPRDRASSDVFVCQIVN